MAAVEVDLLQKVGLVSQKMNHQRIRRCRRSRDYILPILLPTWGLQALGRLTCLDVLCSPLVELLLRFVYFSQNDVVVLLHLGHVLSKRCNLGQEFSLGKVGCANKSLASVRGAMLGLPQLAYHTAILLLVGMVGLVRYPS